jgi:hypothetical protein
MLGGTASFAVLRIDVPGTADLPSPPRHYLAGHLPAFGVNRRSICPRGSREHQVCWELAPVHELIKGRGIEPCGHSDRVAARGQSRALGCRVWRDRWISDEFATKERRGRDAPGGKLPPSWEFPASRGGHGLCSFLARGLSRRQVATRIRKGDGRCSPGCSTSVPRNAASPWRPFSSSSVDLPLTPCWSPRATCKSDSTKGAREPTGSSATCESSSPPTGFRARTLCRRCTSRR